MRIKTIVKNLSLVLSITLLAGLLPPKVANAASLSYAIKPSTLSDKVLTREETSQIESEVDVLGDFLDTSIIKKINVTENGNEYILGYNDIDEKVVIENSDNESVTIIASDGKKSNVISYKKDGSVVIDGHKLQVSQKDQMNTNIAPMAIYTTVESFTPYANLTTSDYDIYSGSGKQNLDLGGSITTLTYTAFTTAIGFYNFFAAVMIGLAGVAIAVYDVIKSINPQTHYLYVEYTIWKYDAFNYEYNNKFYADPACTGPYDFRLSYTHYRVN
jgi:hypothetical protein